MSSQLNVVTKVIDVSNAVYTSYVKGLLKQFYLPSLLKFVFLQTK